VGAQGSTTTSDSYANNNSSTSVQGPTDQADQSGQATGTIGQSVTGTGTAANASGQAATGSEWAKGDANGPETEADRSISQSVTNALMTAGISSQTLGNIHVRANNGRVILTGQVNSQSEKQRIEAQVKQTPGVQTVINQLRVGNETGGASSPGSSNPNSSGLGNSSPSGTSDAATSSPDTGTQSGSAPPAR
jgi:osmotically-inducible protein OsmY